MSSFHGEEFFAKGMPKGERDHVTPRKEFGTPRPPGMVGSIPGSAERLGLAPGENKHFRAPRQHEGLTCATTGSHKLRLPRFDVEIISTPREAQIGDKDSSRTIKYHVVHFNPRNPHVTDDIQKTMQKACELVINAQLRVAPGYHDWNLDWVGVKGAIGDVGLNSFCLMISGLESDPHADKILAGLAVRIDAIFARLGGSRIVVPF